MDIPYLSPFPARQSAGMPYPRLRPRVVSHAPASHWYLLFLGLAMTTGTIVLVEPAPIDMLMMALLAAGLLFRKLAFVPAHEAPLVLLAAFLCANVISMVNVSDMEMAMRYFGITAYLVASWVFFTGVITRHGYRALRLIMNGYVVAGLVSVIPGTLSYLRIIGYQSELLLFGRPRGFFKDPNVFGPYMVPILIWAMVRMQDRSRPLVKAWWVMVAMLSMVAIFFSYSRGCWINCMVALLAFFALQIASGGWSARKFINVAGVLVILVVIVCVVGLIIVNTDPRLAHMLQMRLGYGGVQAYDVSHRFYAQHLAMETIKEKPLGLGPGQTEVAFTIATHNILLRVLVENGILGFLAIYAFLVLTVVRMLRVVFATRDAQWRGAYVMAAACTAGLLVNSLVIDSIHWRHMWFLLALAWVSRSAAVRTAAPARAVAAASAVRPQFTAGGGPA